MLRLVGADVACERRAVVLVHGVVEVVEGG